MELVSMGQISAAANIILTDLNYVRQDELNADEGIINFQNGILRLADMALLPHSPEVLSTIRYPVSGMKTLHRLRCTMPTCPGW